MFLVSILCLYKVCFLTVYIVFSLQNCAAVMRFSTLCVFMQLVGCFCIGLHFVENGMLRNWLCCNWKVPANTVNATTLQSVSLGPHLPYFHLLTLELVHDCGTFLSSCWLKWSWRRIVPFAPPEWMGKRKTASRPNLCAFVEPVLQIVCSHNPDHCGLGVPRWPASVVRAHNRVYLCHALSVNASPFTPSLFLLLRWGQMGACWKRFHSSFFARKVDIVQSVDYKSARDL